LALNRFELATLNVQLRTLSRNNADRPAAVLSGVDGAAGEHRLPHAAGADRAPGDLRADRAAEGARAVHDGVRTVPLLAGRARLLPARRAPALGAGRRLGRAQVLGGGGACPITARSAGALETGGV